MSGIAEVTRVVTDLQSLAAPDVDPRQVAEFEQALSSSAGSSEEGVLHKVAQLSQQHAEARQGAYVSLLSGVGDPVALMDACWTLTRTKLQVELMAQCSGSITKNLDTLMKAQ
ncbi:EscI/YscI/HrpB family type III secretion system inner rod protein [Pseudomonas sp. CCOS 191]|uniref:EscI/YscI/HrpB family type III secretion system inner rod protein n=1 Tax=Pseudomonas sp. CCOS 191 TaxID=1649877 RepID=UPI000624CDFD|nr:EscI/YscI/HrpB family type III secretion system inner rod protein [Pseudomonas sp. CCOS 191]CRI56457.1 hypothetical protein CCOS191_1921 [Pseudomonas sp. CCOS 191]